MNIKIEFNTDNAAFEDNVNELTQVFSQLQETIVRANTSHNNSAYPIRASNGNKIGTITLN